MARQTSSKRKKAIIMNPVQGCGYVTSCWAPEVGRYKGDGEVRGAKPPQFPYIEGGIYNRNNPLDPPPKAPAVPIKDGHLDIVV